MSAERFVSFDFAEDGAVVAVLSGSLDLTDAPVVRESLRPAGRWPRTLVLDLAAVDFCDCAVLGALIAVRGEAGLSGGRVLIAAASPAVRVLLAATQTAALFGYPPVGPGQAVESSADESSG